MALGPGPAIRPETEERRQTLAELLRGVRLLIVAPSMSMVGGQAVVADLLCRHLVDENVDVRLLPINPVPPGFLKSALKVKYLRTLVVSVLYIAQLLRNVRSCDVVHVFSASNFSFVLAPAPALVIARLFGRKTILNYHSGEADAHLRRWGGLIFWLLRRADRIVVPSEYLVGIFAKYGFSATYVYNIFDAGLFVYRERPDVKPSVLVPRSLDPLYDIETAIEVFHEVQNELPSATLTITGSGPQEHRLRRLVSARGLRGVAFAGAVDRARMAELYGEADIMLNTSLVDNMPISILEAFGSGVAVVTTDAGGIPFVVRNRETGILLPTKDVKGLAAAIVELTRNDRLRRELVENGRRELVKYDWSTVKHKWAGIYKELARSIRPQCP